MPSNHLNVLKADRPHPRDYSTHRQTPWTDNDSSSAVRVVTDGQTDGQTDGRTDGRYQVHYLPRFAVDKNKGPNRHYVQK